MPIRPRSLHRPRRPGVWQTWTVWVYFPAALLLCLLGACLWKSGRWLVAEDPFEKAAWAAVLAGESRDCERTDEAVRLYLDGRIDTIVISSERIFKNRYVSEFMVSHYVREGVPRGKIFEFRQDAYSTLEEARLLIRQFRLQNLDTVVVITSNYHSARARRIFRKLSQGIPFILVHPAEYHAYDPASWWSSRESREIWFTEWMKTVYGWWELFRTPPETGKAEYQNLVPDVWGLSTGRPPGLQEREADAGTEGQSDGRPERLEDSTGTRAAVDSVKPASPPSGVDRGDGPSADSARDSAKAAAARAPASDSAAGGNRPDTSASKEKEKDAREGREIREKAPRDSVPAVKPKPAAKAAKNLKDTGRESREMKRAEKEKAEKASEKAKKKPR